MKIDLHCHTKKVKTGDPETRNVTSTRFAEEIINACIGIVAITNHNYFNLNEFNNYCSAVDGKALVLPGVELDVIDENGINGHVVIVGDDTKKIEFDAAVNNLLGNTNPNDFVCKIDDLINFVNSIDCIVIAHCDDKTPHLSDKSLDKIYDSITDNYRFFREPIKLKSACIHIYDGSRYIIGSDVQDWDKYSSEEFPETKLDISSFKSLMMFLKRDEEVVKTLLRNHDEYNDIDVSSSNKKSEMITLYRGINVIFGDKATGKTVCLQKINEYFEKKNKSIAYYDSKTVKETIEDLKKVEANQKSLSYYQKDTLEVECDTISNWKESAVTQLSDYMTQFKSTSANKNRERMKIAQIDNGVISNTNIDLHRKNFLSIEKIINNINSLEPETYLQGDDLINFEKYLALFQEKIAEAYCRAFINEKATSLANFTIQDLKDIIANKTNAGFSPLKTGLVDFVKNRLKLYEAVIKVYTLFAFSTDIEEKTISIGADKKIKLVLHAEMLNSSETKGKGFDNVTLAKGVRKELDNIYKNLFDSGKIKESIKKIRTLFENDGKGIKFNMDLFLGVYKYFMDENGAVYVPSGGERVLIALDDTLNEKTDIYLFDEPEDSLSNNYVNDFLLPSLQRLEQQNKLIVVVTHNANIAIRSLPYSSILKTHVGNIYQTYLGSPYLMYMTNVCDDTDKKVWKDESIRLLEGGKEAFEERGDIYGIR